jgi:GT2 family glycosyltransferase
MHKVGIVVIGRNEEPRLEACLASMAAFPGPKVYVDSGSRDRSPLIAEEHGLPVIRLHEGPYTAARGRQLGLEDLRRRHPDLQYVQFIDGDCALRPGWLEKAEAFLDGNPEVAVVVGRLRERRAAESLLVRLIDVEWDLPIGETDTIGGISMVRIQPILAVGGWNTSLITGEDMDFGARLRAQGWRLIRVADEMTLHDIGITRAAEVWRRGIRSGFTYAELAARHGKTRCRRWRRRALGNVAYGAVLPLGLPISLWLWWPGALIIAAVYAALIARIAADRWRRGDRAGFAVLYGAMLAVLKVAAAGGTIKYGIDRLRHRQSRLMEYKSSAGPA